jgi:hypothetical protein
MNPLERFMQCVILWGGIVKAGCIIITGPGLRGPLHGSAGRGGVCHTYWFNRKVRTAQILGVPY